MEQGFTIWITGLPGAGKKAMAEILSELIAVRGKKTVILSDTESLEIFGGEVGGNEDEWAVYSARLAFICKKVMDVGGIPIVASASPFRELREDLRAEIGSYFEIYIHTDPEKSRTSTDNAGLFEKVNEVFEEPFYPDHRYEPGETSLKEAVDMVIQRLEDMEMIEPAGEVDYNDEEEKKIEERLRGLGYIE
jgi:adenylylsulfate kinase-like enzyme